MPRRISQDPRTTRLAASHHHHRSPSLFASKTILSPHSSFPRKGVALRPSHSLLRVSRRVRSRLALGMLSPAPGPSRADASATRLPRSARWRRVAGRGTTTTAPAAGAVPGAPRASSPRAPSRLALARDLPARVYIEHTDAYRVVYHANYFKFMRRAREAIFFGEPTTTPDRSPAADDPTNDDGWLSGWADAATVVAVDACRFASPLVLGDDLVVRTRVLAAGARTLAVRQEVVRTSAAEDAPERLALAADVVVVPLDDARRPVAVPRALRDRLVRGEENDGISEDAVEHASSDPAWLFGGASEEDASDDPSDAAMRSGVSERGSSSTANSASGRRPNASQICSETSTKSSADRALGEPPPKCRCRTPPCGPRRLAHSSISLCR